MITSLEVFLVLTAIVVFGLAVYALLERKLPGALPYCITMILAGGYALTYTLEINARELGEKLFWINVQYFPIALLPVSWLVTAIQYSGQSKWLTNRRLIFLMIIPLITILLIWTSPYHHLFRYDVYLDSSGLFPVVGKSFGPWYWVHFPYSYILLIIAFYLFLNVAVRSSQVQRKQPVYILAGFTVVIFGNLIYVMGVTPFPEVDLTPLTFLVSGVLIAWGLFRHRLIDIIPYARDQLMKRMQVGVVVTDSLGIILDLNTEAERIFGKFNGEALGKPLFDIIPEVKNLVTLPMNGVSRQMEISLGSQQIELRFSPLEGFHGFSGGNLALVHDITEYKRAEHFERAMFNISKATNTMTDLQELYLHVHNIVSDVLGMKSLYIGEYDETSDALRIAYDYDELDGGNFLNEKIANCKTSPRLTAYLLRQARLLSLSKQDILELEKAEGLKLIGTVPEYWLGIPLFTAEGRVIGVFVVSSYNRAEKLTEKSQELLTFISTQLASAIERKQAEEALRNSQSRYQNLFEESPISIWEEDFSQLKHYIDKLMLAGNTDIQGYFITHPDEINRCLSLVNIIDVNQATLRLYKKESKADFFHFIKDIILKTSVNAFVAELVAISRGDTHFGWEGYNSSEADRRFFWISWSVVPGYENSYGRVIVTLVDMTESRQAQEKLLDAERRYHELVERVNAVIYIDNNDEESSTIYMSPQIEKFLGYSSSDWHSIPDLWPKLIHPDDRERVLAEHERTNKSGEPFSIEYRMISKEGKVLWFHDDAVRLFDQEGKPSHWQGILYNITELKQTEEKLRFLSFHDSLTGAYNRTFFEEEILRLEHSRNYPISVIIIDVDGMKQINDTLGHAAGDELLKRTANLLRCVFRAEDIVARIGGDEFAVLLPGIGMETVQEAILRIRQILSKDNIQTGNLALSLSMGMAVAEKGDPILQKIKQADDAMYREKKKRRYESTLETE